MKIGLTGGIGSGKSTVAKLIWYLGFPVYHADSEAKWLINNDKYIRHRIISLLGEEAYGTDGYNTKYVSRKVFSDQKLLSGLNEIVHPAVKQHFNAWCQKYTSDVIVFQEAAILFENESYTKFDKTILVTAPEEIRIQRVMKRDNFTEAEVKARMSKQWSDEEKIPLADFVLKCDGQHLVIKQVMDIIKKLGWDY